MAITQAMPTSFKQELMQALHDFDNPGGNTFKIALYTSSATLGDSTTAYTVRHNEVSGTNYSAGGNTLASVTPTTGGTTLPLLTLLTPLGLRQRSRLTVL
jgi:hypothetical protein